MKLLFTIYLLFSTLLLANAQIFVKHDATGTNDGTSWTNAFTDLQDALNVSASGSQIWIAAGTYKPTGPTPDSSHFLATNPVQLYGGFLGTETTVDQRDWETYQTIFSGDLLGNDVPGDFDNNRTDNAHHVLIINAPNTESVIDGLVFEGGASRLDAYAATAVDIPYNRWSGGALYLYQSGAVIRNCLFHNNAAFRGSGCFAFGDTLNSIALRFENVTFRDNNGYNGAGGFFQAFQDLQFTNTQVTGNTGFQGGGLFFSGSNATVKNCVLDSNTATYGGAMLSFHTNLYIQHPELKVLNSSFTGNMASAWGGGLFVNNTYGGFSVEVDSCSFTGNSTGSNGYGGGIEIWDQQDALPVDPLTTINITNSEFIDNTSAIGGGVTIEGEDDSVKIVIDNVKFEGNMGVRGGGLTVYSYAKSKVDFLMRNTEFTGNVASIGGGMSMEGINNTYRLNYLLEDCSFNSNIGQNGVGALNIQHYPRPDGVIGTIRRVSFEDNHGGGLSGAFTASHGNHLIEDSYFFANSTDATLDSLYHGGGAINILGPAEIYINRSIFDANTSLTEGSAIAATDTVTSTIENTLFHHQEGSSTIYFDGELNLMNTTMVENEGGLFLQNGSATEIQNSIFDNQDVNLRWDGEPTITSNGGNISSDGSMTGVLTGSGSYEDFNNTDPLLGLDFVPLPGSPAIDAGNPEGVTSLFDLEGNPRISGNSIDIGSYETFLVAVQDATWHVPECIVFPNPVTDQLNFQLRDEWIGNIEVNLYNKLGQLVMQENQQKTSSTQGFTLGNIQLVPGEYFMLVQANLKTYGNKVIVQ